MIKNKVMKKRGFTLIELIVSIAILGILIPAIMSSFVNTENTMRDENSKIDITTSAQTIVQALQALGYSNIDSLYNSLKSSQNQRGSLSEYIYFNVYDDIDTLLNYEKYDSANYTPITKSTTGDYDGAKSAVPGDKNYNFAANITISTTSSSLDYYRVYKVICTVWDMNNSNVSSQRVAYIGE